jgi:hypothetical protein
MPEYEVIKVVPVWELKLGGTKRAPTFGSPSERPGSSNSLLVVRLEGKTTVTITEGLMKREGVAEELIHGGSLSDGVPNGLLSLEPLWLSLILWEEVKEHVTLSLGETEPLWLLPELSLTEEVKEPVVLSLKELEPLWLWLSLALPLEEGV